jgi:hypothetical protein
MSLSSGISISLMSKDAHHIMAISWKQWAARNASKIISTSNASSHAKLPISSNPDFFLYPLSTDTTREPYDCGGLLLTAKQFMATSARLQKPALANQEYFFIAMATLMTGVGHLC